MNRLSIVPVLLFVALLAGCASSGLPRNPAADWQPSPNHEPRRPRMVILHHTAMETAEGALHVLQTRNAGGPVSSHYLIGDDGHVYQLVSEQARAWHAGASRWGGVSDLNSMSIGIELDNNGREPFSEAQIAALLVLLEDIVERNGIQPHLVLAHGDVAPTNKDDPSALFPWRRLAEAGFGLWPGDVLLVPPAGFDRWAALRLVGYDLRDPPAALAAFHRHYLGSEEREWRSGDAAILYDLRRQLMEMEEPAAAMPIEEAGR